MEPRPQSPSLVSLLGLQPRALPSPRERDELYIMWSAARAEANLAYESWRDSPGPETFWAYRAAEERADAAQDALAEVCSRYTAGRGFDLAA